MRTPLISPQARSIPDAALAAAALLAALLPAAAGCGRSDRSRSVIVWEQMDP